MAHRVTSSLAPGSKAETRTPFTDPDAFLLRRGPVVEVRRTDTSARPVLVHPDEGHLPGRGARLHLTIEHLIRHGGEQARAVAVVVGGDQDDTCAQSSASGVLCDLSDGLEQRMSGPQELSASIALELSSRRVERHVAVAVRQGSTCPAPGCGHHY